MKKVSLIIILLSIYSPNIQATHIIGGELNYHYLGNDNYEVQLTVFRDCKGPVGLNARPFQSIGVLNNNNKVLDDISLPLISTDTLFYSDMCISSNQYFCSVVDLYMDTIEILPATGGYEISYRGSCCRTISLNVTAVSNAITAYFYTTIPDTSIAQVNSNPIFNKFPPSFICKDSSFVFDYSAVDLDGDSLSYELITPLNNPIINNPISWVSPYSVTNVFGGVVPLTINSKTGLMTGTPDKAGVFAMAVKVSEYRNGVLLSETIRTHDFNVQECTKYTAAAAVAPDYSCESFTVTFENKSFGQIESFFWDFGDTLIDTDTTSIADPVYTYSAPGEYIVQLIAYSSFRNICNDTAYTTVTILPEFTQQMDFEYNTCIQKVLFNSVTTLDTTETVIYNWNFGDGVGTSGLKSPSYTYSNPGKYTVELISYSPNNPGCNDTGAVEVSVLPEFKVVASVEEIACSADADFFATSTYDDLFSVKYSWDFDVPSLFSDTSDVANISYNYSEPGEYKPRLIVSTQNPKCNDTIELQLRIYPDFEFDYVLKNIKCSYKTEYAAFSSLDTILKTNYFWDFGDGGESTASKGVHDYNYGGSYNVKLTVNTESGCIDSMQNTIEINTTKEVFVPNIFTPNTDGKNDVFYLGKGEDLSEMVFQIYNRFGKKVFETNDQRIGWDGTYNGETVHSGVYFYFLSFNCFNNEEVIQKGNVSVIR